MATTIIASIELLQSASSASKYVRKQLRQYAVEVGSSYRVYLLKFWQDENNKDYLMLVEDLHRIANF